MPKTIKSVPVLVRLPEDTLQKLEAYRGKQGIARSIPSRTGVIRKAIEIFLKGEEGQ